MCFKCHTGLSDEFIHKELINALDKKNYNEWNTTSVNHMFLIASGLNGYDNKILAIEVLMEFIEYLKTKPSNYMPINSLENMYSVTYIINLLNNIIKNSNSYFDNLCL